MRFILWLLALGMIASPAQADWYRADSENFVIFADDSEKDVARFAEMLERYHAAMSFVTGREVVTPSPSNRVTIYAVGSERTIRKLAGARNVGGFYMPRAGGSVAFVPDVRASSGELDFSMITLLHEYAHHFLIGSSRFAMPRWMDEGGAEFFASARFPRSGEVHIGRPARHRAYELALAPEVSIHELFERGAMDRDEGNSRDNFYGRSWALYHFLTFTPERKGQLLDYARKVAAGADSTKAAQDAFGDLKTLEDDLDRYLKKRKLLGFVLQPDLLPIRPISVVRLSEGMDAMLPIIIRSKRGVDRETAQEVLADAREVAVAFPGDAGVLAALAEAEFDAGHDDAAIAAADAALAIDPAVKNALVQKGYALFRKAADADDEDAAYAAAMEPFAALNALEQDHPLPLIYYYRSFVERGQAPSENARHALERAAELSPFDHSLAMNAGVMQAREGKIAIARRTLGPIAADPHGGGMARAAQAFLDDLSDVPEGTEWQPRRAVELDEALATIADEDDGEGGGEDGEDDDGTED